MRNNRNRDNVTNLVADTNPLAAKRRGKEEKTPEREHTSQAKKRRFSEGTKLNEKRREG